MTFRNAGQQRRRLAVATTVAALAGAIASMGAKDDGGSRTESPASGIEHVLVIDLENEDYGSTFGPASPAVYLNQQLLPQGQLVVNYFATSHVSLGNYISQVSGQSPTPDANNDCLDLSSLSHPPVLGGFTSVLPGSDAAEHAQFPGQVVGNGCVFPAPSGAMHGARTIGDQLDALLRADNDQDHSSSVLSKNPRAGEDDQHQKPARLNWREYAEDMGNDLARDYGTPDPLGGTACAHPPINGHDFSNSAAPHDQYATRHNPFVYFHSVIDDQARCEAHVVPLGRVQVGSGGAHDTFTGHLQADLRRIETTPRFMFVTPNLCNDGHDPTCAGPNVEGTTNAAGQNIGGLVGADLWLKHWMPMILSAPAYRSGKLLVVITFDESGLTDARACPATDQSACRSPIGPNVTNPGFSSVLALFGLQTPPTANYVYAGGGQVGAVLLNARYIEPGTVNTTGVYNHYSALRSYEDLLGIVTGGDDGRGHLGYAAVRGLKSFGRDVFNRRGDDER